MRATYGARQHTYPAETHGTRRHADTCLLISFKSADFPQTRLARFSPVCSFVRSPSQDLGTTLALSFHRHVRPPASRLFLAEYSPSLQPLRCSVLADFADSLNAHLASRFAILLSSPPSVSPPTHLGGAARLRQTRAPPNFPLNACSSYIPRSRGATPLAGNPTVSSEKEGCNRKTQERARSPRVARPRLSFTRKRPAPLQRVPDTDTPRER